MWLFMYYFTHVSIQTQICCYVLDIMLRGYTQFKVFYFSLSYSKRTKFSRIGSIRLCGSKSEDHHIRGSEGHGLFNTDAYQVIYTICFESFHVQTKHTLLVFEFIRTAHNGVQMGIILKLSCNAQPTYA